MSTHNQFTLRFDTDNADFTDDPAGAVRAVLDAVAFKIETGQRRGTVRDRNGNTVGEFVWTQEG